MLLLAAALYFLKPFHVFKTKRPKAYANTKEKLFWQSIQPAIVGLLVNMMVLKRCMQNIKIKD
jgi:hypothetical protein